MLKTIMKPALIYTYWQNEPGDPVKNLHSPIILSIATFRNFDKEVPVYVIDMSGNATWGDWPNRFNFEVKSKTWILSNMVSDCFQCGTFPIKGRMPIKETAIRPKELSRPEAILWLIRQIHEDVIISSDSDMVFVNNLFPLLGDLSKLNIAPNIGLFYFGRYSLCEKFMETWAAFCIAAANSEVLREEIVNFAHPYPRILHEETVSKYLLQRYENLFEFGLQPKHENFLLNFYMKDWDWIDWDVIKTIHLQYTFVEGEIPKEKRAEWFLAIKESNEILKSSFTEEELKSIFEDPNKYDESTKSYRDINYMKRMMGRK